MVLPSHTSSWYQAFTALVVAVVTTNNVNTAAAASIEAEVDKYNLN